MKLSNEHFYNLLTPNEKVRFITNLKSATSMAGVQDYIYRRTSETFTDFMKGSFIFNSTPEGHEYWQDVINKARPKNPQLIKPDLEDKVKVLETTIEELKKENSLLVLENTKLQEKVQKTRIMVNSSYGLQDHPLTRS